MSTATFWDIGGYDERITTYGWDDTDLYQRFNNSDVGLPGHPVGLPELSPVREESTQSEAPSRAIPGVPLLPISYSCLAHVQHDDERRLPTPSFAADGIPLHAPATSETAFSIQMNRIRARSLPTWNADFSHSRYEILRNVSHLIESTTTAFLEVELVRFQAPFSQTDLTDQIRSLRDTLETILYSQYHVPWFALHREPLLHLQRLESAYGSIPPNTAPNAKAITPGLIVKIKDEPSLFATIPFHVGRCSDNRLCVTAKNSSQADIVTLRTGDLHLGLWDRLLRVSESVALGRSLQRWTRIIWGGVSDTSGHLHGDLGVRFENLFVGIRNAGWLPTQSYMEVKAVLLDSNGRFRDTTNSMQHGRLQVWEEAVVAPLLAHEAGAKDSSTDVYDWRLPLQHSNRAAFSAMFGAKKAAKKRFDCAVMRALYQNTQLNCTAEVYDGSGRDFKDQMEAQMRDKLERERRDVERTMIIGTNTSRHILVSTSAVKFPVVLDSIAQAITAPLTLYTSLSDGGYTMSSPHLAAILFEHLIPHPVVRERLQQLRMHHRQVVAAIPTAVQHPRHGIIVFDKQAANDRTVDDGTRHDLAKRSVNLIFSIARRAARGHRSVPHILLFSNHGGIYSDTMSMLKFEKRAFPATGSPTRLLLQLNGKFNATAEVYLSFPHLAGKAARSCLACVSCLNPNGTVEAREQDRKQSLTLWLDTHWETDCAQYSVTDLLVQRDLDVLHTVPSDLGEHGLAINFLRSDIGRNSQV